MGCEKTRGQKGRTVCQVILGHMMLYKTPWLQVLVDKRHKSYTWFRYARLKTYRLKRNMTYLGHPATLTCVEIPILRFAETHYACVSAFETK